MTRPERSTTANVQSLPVLSGRVLLVEDNPNNQSVARAMLSEIGLDVSVADDGAQAVARVRKATYDIVLMDCQMPVMGGLEASAVIRNLPERRGSEVPIIALTGNAMQNDEQACLDAGMNAFLAKPYTLAALRDMLAQWLPAADNAVAVDVPAVVVPLSSVAINVHAIEILRNLEEPTSTALVTQLVSSFLATADADLARACIALKDENTGELSRTAHRLKSSAANLGAETLAACYGEIEKHARESRLDNITGLLDEVRLEQQRAMDELRELLKVAA